MTRAIGWLARLGLRPAGAARLGDVRLGQLGVPVHRSSPRCSRSTSHGRRRRACRHATATARFAHGPRRSRSTIIAVAVARSSALSPTIAGAQEADARASSWPSASSRPRRWSSSRAATGGSPRVLFMHRQHRHLRRSFVFYDSLLPHIAQPRGDRPRVDRGLRARLSRRRPAARDQPGVDPEAGAGSACADAGAAIAAVVRQRRGLVARSSRSRCSAACPSRPCDPRSGRARAGPRPRRRSRGSIETFRELRALPAGLPDARRVPALQRRHRDDHPHGDDLRRRDRHRPETR